MTQITRHNVGVFHLIFLLACFATAVANAQTSRPGDDRGNPPNNDPGGSGNAGGVTLGDFNPLLNLITSTIDSDIWSGIGSGEATLEPYAQGVFADAQGTLQYKNIEPAKNSGNATAQSDDSLARRATEATPSPADLRDARAASALRFVSLRRLENYIADRLEQRQAFSAEVLTMAGLQQIKYVLVVPASDQAPGDLVLAGPAGDWQVSGDGIIVSTETGHPVVRFDDLLTLWRRDRPAEPFGVTIEPEQKGLASVQQYLKATTAQPIKPNKRKRWVEGLRDTLGKQDVRFFGLRPNSHVARVLLTADYHMKCIGMGLAQPVDGVKSYLKTVKLDDNGQVPPMSVLRWWFAMNYQPVEVSENAQVFAFVGPGAKVLSENQLMAARGRRIRTGQSEKLNRQFADSFTAEFTAICEKYPLYGELKNVFDLAMTVALIDQQKLLDRADWQPTLLLDRQALKLPQVQVAEQVDTIVNHRVIGGKQIVAGISGGVWVDSVKQLKQQVNVTVDGGQSKISGLSSAKVGSEDAGSSTIWWWD